MAWTFPFDEYDVIEVVEEFVFYDQPLLFTGKNPKGQIFFVNAVDESDTHHTWMLVEISPERLDKVRTGEIDIHDAFAESETGTVIIATMALYDYEPRPPKVVKTDQIPIDYLASPGIGLGVD